MIGTQHFSRRARLMAYLLLASLAGPGARGDEIQLEGGKLTGQITGIDESGAIFLQTPLAIAPVGIQPAAIRKIILSSPADTRPRQEGVAELSNGDKLPGDINSYLNGFFEIATSYAGTIRIPRAAVSAVHFGIRQETTLLSGSGQASDWLIRDGWVIEDNDLVAKTPGTIHRPLNLPNSFRYRGHVSWTGQQNQPNLQIFFAESSADQKPDCYILTFNYAGLELKRQNSLGKAWNSIQIFDLRPENFHNFGFDYEIRLNRAGAQPVLEILIDGESKGKFQDVSTSLPTGGGIGFRANEGAEVRIGKIEITSWDAKGDLFRAENRGDATKDSVIYDKGQRTAGELLEIRPARPAAKVIFKSPLAGSLELPADVVSSVFLVKADDQVPPQPFVISLRGGGRLHAALQASHGDHITLLHPLVGTLSLPRAAISMIERSPAPAKP